MSKKRINEDLFEEVEEEVVEDDVQDFIEDTISTDEEEIKKLIISSVDAIKGKNKLRKVMKTINNVNNPKETKPKKVELSLSSIKIGDKEISTIDYGNTKEVVDDCKELMEKDPRTWLKEDAISCHKKVIGYLTISLNLAFKLSEYYTFHFEKMTNENKGKKREEKKTWKKYLEEQGLLSDSEANLYRDLYALNEFKKFNRLKVSFSTLAKNAKSIRRLLDENGELANNWK